MKLKFTILFALAIITITSRAQEFEKNAIGFGFSLIDFTTAKEIKNTSLTDALNGSNWKSIQTKIPAFNIDYWRAITNHVDLSVRYTGAIIRYPFENRVASEDFSQQLFSQLDASLNIKMLKETSVFNPFLTAGIGAFNYKSDIGALVPLGAGFQFNFGNTAYLIPQVQYRIGITNDATDHLQYSLTFLQSLFKPKEKPVAPVILPPVVEVPKDTDGDGIIDEKDECPSVAGTAALNGCPDSDKDGIADKNDKCPNQAGIIKYQGCPIPDSDNDGINDEEDKCPNQAGLARYQGCPIPDSDNDAVNDEVDKCPHVPGPASNNGCPTLEQYNFNYKNIQFATGSSVLTAGAKTELNKLVIILNEHPELKIAIEGYTDITGKAASNQILSEKRAASVKTYLVSKGISADRLTAVGFGIQNPIADNATVAGRTQNRRVEFKTGE